MSNPIDWPAEYPAPITVCDRQGIILAMNQRSQAMFADSGGGALIGQNLLDCHPGDSREKVQQLLTHPRPNVYTIEKQGRKKLIYQAPWFREGVFQGLVEIEIELPETVPNFVRE
jgi:transcriptional regulator with PAS, ATPase and Fis domain